MVRPPWLGREIGDALAHVGAPAYILDHNGIVRWMNKRAIDLLGDHRGGHFTLSIAPEAQSKARIEFTKKMLGTARTSDFKLFGVLSTGERVPVEIHSVVRSRTAGALSASSASSRSTMSVRRRVDRRPPTSRRASTRSFAYLHAAGRPRKSRSRLVSPARLSATTFVPSCTLCG